MSVMDISIHSDCIDTALFTLNAGLYIQGIKREFDSNRRQQLFRQIRAYFENFQILQKVDILFTLHFMLFDTFLNVKFLKGVYLKKVPNIHFITHTSTQVNLSYITSC